MKHSLFSRSLLLASISMISVPQLAFSGQRAQAAPAAKGVPAQEADGGDEAGTAGSDHSICPPPSAENNLIIHHIYIGQGDSTFIRTPGGKLTILIDGGESGHQVEILDTLQRCYGLGRGGQPVAIDYMVLSHPHSDHFGGLLELLKKTPEGIAIIRQKAKGASAVAAVKLQPTFQVNRGVYLTGFGLKDAESNKDPALGNKLRGTESQVGFIEIAAAIDKRLGLKDVFIPYGTGSFVGAAGAQEPVKFNVVVHDGITANGKTVRLTTNTNPPRLIDPNSTSSGIHVNFGTFDYFTSGDLSGGGGVPDVETALVQSGLIDKMDVIKANHHGSDTSNNLEFLKTVNPTVYVISAGDAGQNTNSFHLPRIEPILNMHQLVTAQNGAIFMTSCGAGNIMPAHPFCEKINPIDQSKEAAKKSSGKTPFDYQTGQITEINPQTKKEVEVTVDGGVADGAVIPGTNPPRKRPNLPRFLDAQGDVIVIANQTAFEVLTAHNPQEPNAKIEDAAKDEMPPFKMEKEPQPKAYQFKTDNIDAMARVLERTKK